MDRHRVRKIIGRSVQAVLEILNAHKSITPEAAVLRSAVSS